MRPNFIGVRGIQGPRPQVAVPRQSDLLWRSFRWWVRRYVRKHFHAVRLSRGSHVNVPHDLPLIIVLNHPSWWDPLIGAILTLNFSPRTHYAPMEARALERYPLFDRLGFYPVEQGTALGALAFLERTRAILAQPNVALWITAQGRFTDPRCRPPQLQPGIGHIARRLNRGLIVTLALEYLFWDERLPEALARFGEPIRIEANRSLTVSEWVALIEDNLETAQNALAADALARDPARFDTLLAGRVAIGGVYDQCRRLRAWVRGERFQAEHGSAERSL